MTDDQKFFNRMYRAGASYGTGYSVMRRLLLQLETGYTHTFKQDGYSPEYWGARYTNYALDFYGVRGF